MKTALAFTFALLVASILFQYKVSFAEASPPLIKSLDLKTSDGKVASSFSKNQNVLLSTTFENPDDVPFVLVVDVRDELGISVFIKLEHGSTLPESHIEETWTPQQDGTFTIRTFVLTDNLEMPDVLSTVVSKPLTVGASGVEIQPEKADYTVMIYMVGADLESKGYFATEEIKEMTSADASPKLNVILETGGAANATVNQNRTIDFTHTQRHQLVNAQVKQLDDLGQLNMGNPETLSDFLVYGVSTFPANKYVVILWGHGGGINGYGFDDSANDVLDLPELQQAFSDAKAQTGAVYELIGFDSCLMATIEVMSDLDEYGNYLVSSQELEPAWGWDYNALLSFIADNPNKSGLEMGRIVADSYKVHTEEKAKAYEDFKGQETITLSVVDLSKIDRLVESQDTFSRELSKQVSSISAARGFARTLMSTERFAFGSETSAGHLDLHHFSENVAKQFPSLAQSAQDLQNAIEEAVPYSIHSEFHLNSGGISLFLPLDSDGSVPHANDAYMPGWITISDNYKTYLSSDKAPPQGEMSYNLSDKFYGVTTSDDAYRIEIIVYKQIIENTAGEIVSIVDDYITPGTDGKFDYPFDKQFISLCNNETCIPVSASTIEIAKTKYAIFPVRLESAEINADVSLIYKIDEAGKFEFIGAWPGTNDDGSASRELLPLSDGDKIFVESRQFDLRPGDKYNKSVEHYSILVDEGFAPAYHRYDGTYYVAASVCDYVGNCMNSQSYPFVNRSDE